MHAPNMGDIFSIFGAFLVKPRLRYVLQWTAFVWECVTAAGKAFGLANAKGKDVNELVIKSLDS